MSDREKFMTIILIFGIWGYFAYMELTPVSGYVQALRDALLGFGVFQAALTIPPTK